MADLRIALGAEFDVASGKELSDGFADLKRSWRDEMRRSRQKPIYRPLAQYINIGNMNQFDAKILVLGSPAAGRIWRIPRITVLGNGDTSVLTGVSAALYIGDDQNAALTQCVQHGQQIPFTTIENEHAFVVHSRDSLFVNIFATAAAVGVSVTVSALAWEYPDDAYDAQAI